MAAQETYRIHETTSVVLRENDPHKAAPSDIAIVKSQAARLLDLLYKDAERGFEYDYIKVKRYVVYLTPADLPYIYTEDGKRIGEFSRLDMAELVCAALNATVALVGDGVTDETATVTKAIQTASIIGKVIPATYHQNN